METQPVLITGANGFLGKEIILHLQESRTLVRGTDKDQGCLSPGIPYYPADITEQQNLSLIAQGVSTIIHTAGLAHIYEKGPENVDMFYKNNVIGTENIANAVAEAGVSHFIMISSVSVYGPSTYGVFSEDTPCCPVGPYAKSKYQAELVVTEIARNSGMALTILRMATLYGEGDFGNVGRLVRALNKGRFFWIGSGNNQKSLLYKGDAARACLAVAVTPTNGVNVYNVSAPPCSMREVVESLAFYLGKSIPRWSIPPLAALFFSRMLSFAAFRRGRLTTLYPNVQKWLSDNVYDGSRFERKFNFKPKMSLQEGLHREVEWYQNQLRKNSV